MDEKENMSHGGSLPLACVPGAIPAEARASHFERVDRVFAAARDRVSLQDGYAFRFDCELLIEIARFTEQERLCCPFLTITLEQRPAGGSLWLYLTGPAGTREFLDSELPTVDPERHGEH